MALAHFVRGNEDEKAVIVCHLSEVMWCFRCSDMTAMYMMLGFGDSEPPDNGTSFPLFAFFVFVPGFVISATTTFDVFAKVLLRFSLNRHSERDVCV